MIKTINLNGSEIKVTELGGDNTEIINNSSGIIYASKLPNVTVGGDEVIAIPAGAIDGLYGTHGTVYLLGTGSVELRGVDHKITESRGQSSGDSLGVFADYVDDKSAETLEIAKTYADVKDSEMLVSVKEYADSLNAELAGYIGYTDNDIYGLEADFENCVFTRLAGAVGKNAGTDFDIVNAYGGRRRCNLSDNGDVLAYYGDANFKADGSNGQVMVEQPKFYYRVVPLKTEKINGADGYHLRKARYYISDTPKTGFKVHPAFVQNGVEVDRIYLSAFEGCIYDTSAGTYLLEDEQIADFNSDKLSSIADAKPCSGLTQSLTKDNARELAHNRGKGWEQTTIQTVSATQMLFIIEYASFNSQNEVGFGITAKQDNGLSNLSEKTGATLGCGNKTEAINGSEKNQFVSYRGEENMWGNQPYFIENIFIHNPDNADSGTVGKILFSNNTLDTGLRACFKSGYISAFGYSQDFDWLFITSDQSGNSSFPIGDYCWNENTKMRSLTMSGTWYQGAQCGLFDYSYGDNEFTSSRARGARLTYADFNL